MPKPQRQPHQYRLPRQVKAVWRKKEAGEVEGRKKEVLVQQNVWRTGAINSKVATKDMDVCFSVGEEDMEKFKNMFIGTVRTPGSTYSVHEWFSMQGFFSLKVTPLGANKVLLEEMEEGVMLTLLKDYKDWVYEKFEDIRGWEPDVIDNERVVWVRCHGIPVHAWNDTFFASLTRNFGEYLGVDEDTRTKTALDMARIRLRSNRYDVFNAVVNAKINGSLFPIKVVEEWCGPLQWIENSCCKKTVNFDDSSDFDDENDGEPPLFSVEDDCFNDYEEDGDDGENDPENEGEKEDEYDEVSVVQETSGMHEVRRLENDCDIGGKPKGLTIEDGGENILNVEVENVACEPTHVSNSRGHGGSYVDESDGVVKEALCCERDGTRIVGGAGKGVDVIEEDEGNINNAEMGAMDNYGGCEDQISPGKIKKGEKKNGPDVTKKKEKRKKKKEKEAQQTATYTSQCNSAAT